MTGDPCSPLDRERAEENAAEIRAICGLPPDPHPRRIPHGRPGLAVLRSSPDPGGPSPSLPDGAYWVES